MNHGEIDFTGVDLNSLGDEMITVDEGEAKSAIATPETIDLNKSTNEEPSEKEEKEKTLEDLIDVSNTTKAETTEKDTTDENVEIDTSTPSQQDPGDSPSNSSLITLAKALVEEGVLTELPEDFGGEIDDLFKLVGDEINRNTEKWIHNLPKPIKDVIENYQEGVPLDRIIQTKSKEVEYAGVTDEILEKNEELQKYLIKQDLKNRGYNDAKILKRLKTFEDTEQLEEEAKDALGSLKQLEVYNQSQLKKQAKVQRENQENQNKKTLEDIQSAVNKTDEIVPGIKLTKRSRTNLYKSLTEIVGESEQGQPMNAVMQKRMKDPLQFELTLHYLNNLGVFDGDFSKLVNTGKTTAVQNLKKQLENTSSNFAGRNSGVSRSKEADDIISGMKMFE